MTAVSTGTVVIVHERKAGHSPRGVGTDRLVSVDAKTGRVLGRAMVDGGALLAGGGGKVFSLEQNQLVVRDATSLDIVANGAATRARIGELAPGSPPCTEAAGDALRMTTSDGRFVRLSLPGLEAAPIESPTCSSPESARDELQRSSVRVLLQGIPASVASRIVVVDARGQRSPPETFLRAGLLDAGDATVVAVVHQSSMAGDADSMLSLVSLDDAKLVWQARLRSKPPTSITRIGELLLVHENGGATVVDARSGAILWTRGVL